MIARQGARGVVRLEIGVTELPTDVLGGPQRDDTTSSGLLGLSFGATIGLGRHFEVRLLGAARYELGAYVAWACPEGGPRTSCTATWWGLGLTVDAALRARWPDDSPFYLGAGTEVGTHLIFATREWSEGSEHEAADADQVTAAAGVFFELGFAIGRHEDFDLGLRIATGLGGRDLNGAWSSAALFVGSTL